MKDSNSVNETNPQAGTAATTASMMESLPDGHRSLRGNPVGAAKLRLLGDDMRASEDALKWIPKRPPRGSFAAEESDTIRRWLTTTPTCPITRRRQQPPLRPYYSPSPPMNLRTLKGLSLFECVYGTYFERYKPYSSDHIVSWRWDLTSISTIIRKLIQAIPSTTLVIESHSPAWFTTDALYHSVWLLRKISCELNIPEDIIRYRPWGKNLGRQDPDQDRFFVIRLNPGCWAELYLSLPRQGNPEEPLELPTRPEYYKGCLYAIGRRDLEGHP